MHWFLDPVKNQYADFTGRTGRKEFWMYILVYIGLYIALGIVGGVINFPQVTVLLSLAVLAPNLSITARRLHDIGKSGWWQLISLVPVAGAIVLIYWLAGEGKKESNEYGAAPVQTASEVTGDAPVANAETTTESTEETQN